MSEDQLQAQFWAEVWNRYPQLRHHMWAIPNGANRNPIEASRMKAMGLLAGVWDLHLFWHGTLHIIETKLPGNSLTVDRVVNGKRVYGQKEFGERLAEHGAKRHIYHSLDEGLQLIESILASERQRTMGY